MSEKEVPPSRWHDAQRSNTRRDTSRFQVVITPKLCAVAPLAVITSAHTVTTARFIVSVNQHTNALRSFDNRSSVALDPRMRLRSCIFALLFGAIACRAQQPATDTGVRPGSDPNSTSVAGSTRSSGSDPGLTPAASGVVYVCPMDPDIRSNDPGVCRR